MDDAPPLQLDDIQQRLLGALIEKAMATPQSYPLSLNALTTAANQTTNRDPVTSYSEIEVSGGLSSLRDAELVRAEYAKRSSTPKYAHTLDAHLELNEAEVALLAVLMLRGPQTVGELRQRSDRLYAFGSTQSVVDVLETLRLHRFGSLVEELPRQPGMRETRWRHRFGGATSDARPMPGDLAGGAPGAASGGGPVVEEEGLGERVAVLESQVAELQAIVAELRGLGPTA